MARLRRQVGIQSAQVRLPEPVSAGPAIIKTATTAANLAFEKQADKRMQEAQIAAAAINFERDGDGNLVAPSLPLTEDGLLAPSIYDRQYTQMVGQRYLQQSKIDTAKRISSIATEHWDDPDAFEQVAAAYVQKVTDLAPDRLKPDVNTEAQIRMVEHFNHITRVKAERDHKEAKAVHLQSMQGNLDELIGLYEAGGDPEQIAIKRAEIVAQIAEGSFDGGFNYFTEDEAATHLKNLELKSSFASVVGRINKVPDNPLAYAQEIERMADFKEGDGFIDVVNDDGTVSRVNAAELYPNIEDRAAIADMATSLLTQRAAAFENLQDERLSLKSKTFWDWYSPHALDALPVELGGRGIPIDRDRLYVEFQKAHSDVVNFGYDDTLREQIRALIMQDTMKGGPSWSPERISFDEGDAAYWRMYQARSNELLQGRPIEDLSPQERMRHDFDVEMSVGNPPGGKKQTAGNSKWIAEYYSAMGNSKVHGPDGRDYFNQALQGDEEKIRELQWLAKYQWNKYGVFPIEFSDAIITKLRDPASMDQDTLNNTLRVVRSFWEEPTFKNNMMDDNALGHRIGGALNHMFLMGGQPTPAEAAEHFKNFGDPNYAPNKRYDEMDPDVQEKFESSMTNAMDKYFTAPWWSSAVGVQAPRDANPFDDDVASLPWDLEKAIRDRVKGRSAFINENDPEQFVPYIHMIANETMHEMGYAPSAIGYTKQRFANQRWEFRRPDSAAVRWAPEYYARDGQWGLDDKGNVIHNPTATGSGNVDRKLIAEFSEDVQSVLDWESRRRHKANGGGDEGWVRDWVLGQNAAVQYNAEAVSRAGDGIPRYNILLIRTDGTYEPITETGIHGDALITASMYSAIKRNEERKREIDLRNSEMARQSRTHFQSIDRSMMAL